MHDCFSGSRLEFSPLEKIEFVVCEALPVPLELKIYIKYQCLKKKKKGSHSLFQLCVCARGTTLIKTGWETRGTLQQCSL